MIWNSRIFVVLPVKNFFFKKSSPDFVRIRTHLCTKAFPSQNPVRTGISIHLSIYQKIVLVLFQIKIRNIHPDQLKAMGKLLDALEENDDVQNVWHSLENEEDLPE